MSEKAGRGVAIIGGGPAGLMAAEALAGRGIQVDVYDAMPSLGRKFLLAGIGGLNLTHSEPYPAFVGRYGGRQAEMERLLAGFDADALRGWAHGLGVETFVGSSGRVFPREMKAAPLLRAWLSRLREAGVRFHVRHRWQGWLADGSLSFATPDGELAVKADALLLALGGGSWKKLGSDGRWLPWLAEKGVATAPLLPSNCGFDVDWSAHFAEKFAGEPVKAVGLSFSDDEGRVFQRVGECVVTESGIEGSLIYACSALLRDEIGRNGRATCHLDLIPAWDEARVLAEVTHPRGSRSLSSHLQSRLNLKGVRAGLLRECLDKDGFQHLPTLAAAIKRLPLTLTAARPMDEAISTAGGVSFAALDGNQMLTALPGVFCAGEMLDWEAPTGGYLLTACFASGRAAGLGAAQWLESLGQTVSGASK
ncbi:TIGR03862 family flavoprotein [Chromobacterium sphagni]|uniref:NAD(FAD)-utilizing dehydrogenase n=1 Tax=Chromobacterium sphagni TaxID=1903179 RepID=A0A1S1WXH3_9NEIS|nr:TIGR03862 family flavoprotein [Chromobacterium sphagni]OHX11755.1 NAD(FAD)-utilizing dehydrogenase [Chromobacterium sphagni]OHX20687.1 NAD(FAD)-utilizing dehydrogenase [Chromobacterium sphagni]